MKNKTLFFRNLFFSEEGKEDNESIHQATLYLASSLNKNKKPIIISNAKFSKSSEIISDKEGLDSLLRKNPDINLVIITLIEHCFDKTRELIHHIKEKVSAYIAIGGIMATLNPEHVFTHMPEANIVLKGDGEEVLPKLQSILEGTTPNSLLDEKRKSELSNLNGLIFRNKEDIIRSKDSTINKVKDLDKVYIDFSLMNKENLKEGLNITTSKGCNNGCFFCTSTDKGKFRAKTVEKIKDILNNYKKRLIEIYKKEEKIPDYALKLSIYDDDFLADRVRAIEFFKFIKKTKFKIDFIQTAINSFLIKEEKEYVIDDELIESMDPEIFVTGTIESESYSIYLGTENFCDEELKRLGKNYGFKEIEKVVMALDKKKIRQAHHIILTNTDTTLDNIISNLIKIAILKTKYPLYFDILRPIITNLVSFYPTLSYKKNKEKYGFQNLKIRKWLKSKKSPEMDYPIIEKDIPFDSEVKHISEKIGKYFKHMNYPEKVLEEIMLFLINKKESLKSKGIEKDRITKIEKILDKYHDYVNLIKNHLNKKETNNVFKNNKNNLQIMVTRRCPLRCTYCPIPKKEQDMEYKTLKCTIDLLFTLNEKELRLDFSGGEPLLRFDLVKKGIEYATNLSKIKNKKITFYIVTNALYLTKEVAEFLNEKKVLLELSIDGDEENHNKFKIPVNSKTNPYKESINNLKNIKNKKIEKYIVIVATPDNVNKLFHNFKHILGLGHKKIEINYSIGNMWTFDSMKIFFSQMQEIIHSYKEEIINHKIKLGNLKKRGEPAVLNSEFMIDTDGSIILLNEFLFQTNNKKISPYKHGNVFECKDMNKLYVDKFRVYYSLIKMFGENDTKVRKIIHNNIQMGTLCKKFFKNIKTEIKNGRQNK